MFGRERKDSRRELRSVFRATEYIQTAETPREADIMTGYVLGIIGEKVDSGRLTAKIGDALGKMVEAVGENIHRAIASGRKVESMADYYLDEEDPSESEDSETGA